jgi:hypothetical protein
VHARTKKRLLRKCIVYTNNVSHFVEVQKDGAPKNDNVDAVAAEYRAAELTDRFKKAMETRAAVLNERSRMRKMLVATNRNGGGANGNIDGRSAMANKTAMAGAVAASCMHGTTGP